MADDQSIIITDDDFDEDYEAYERACKEREKENDGYLDEFDEWLTAKGLSDKTIQRHLDNVGFFLNTYLLREDAYEMEVGCSRMDDYLGYFFIRKCMWSTPATIKQNAASFKKFYKCMLEKGHIAQSSYDMLLADIKAGMPEWLADCEDFNNPDDGFFGNPFGDLYDPIPSDRQLFDDLLGGNPSDGGLFSDIYDKVARKLGLDELLGVNPEEDEEIDPSLLPTRQEAIAILTHALLYLTSRVEETPDRTDTVLRAPMALDADALALLSQRGLLETDEGKDTATLTELGEDMAQTWLAIMGLDYLAGDVEGQEPAAPNGWRVI